MKISTAALMVCIGTTSVLSLSCKHEANLPEPQLDNSTILVARGTPESNAMRIDELEHRLDCHIKCSEQEKVGYKDCERIEQEVGENIVHIGKWDCSWYIGHDILGAVIDPNDECLCGEEEYRVVKEAK